MRARHPTGEPILIPLARDRWLASVFSLVPDGATRRRPSDVVRVALAVVVVLLTAISTGWLDEIERWIAEVVDHVPQSIRWVLLACNPWLIVAAVLAIVIAAVVARRLPLGLALAGAGLGSAIVALALDGWVGERNLDALTRSGIDMGSFEHRFPPLLLTVTVAMLLAATPYLTRPTTRLVRIVIVVASACAVALGVGFPMSVAAGLAVAWGVAAAVHLALGSPAATPSRGDIAESLRAFGIDVDATRIAIDPVQVWGESRFLATRPDGAVLHVTAIGRDASDARLFSKVWRVVWYKDSGPSLLLSRAQQVEHQAFVLLLAERVEVVGPDLVAVGVVGESESALLVTRAPEGTPLTELAPEALTDAVLDRAWASVVELHRAYLCHGRLVAGNVLARDDGSIALQDCTQMSSSATPDRLARDCVDLLVTTAALVEVPRALAAATRALGDDGIVGLVPLLQPGVLARTTRKSLPDAKALVASLREAAVAATGIEEPKLAELRRVKPSSIAMAAGAALGVYLLVGELASVADQGNVFADPNWGWLILVVVFSQMPQFAQAIGMLGSVAAPLPLGPVTAVQFANNFTGLVGGTVATTALVVRFFQKQGQAVAVAVSSGVLNTVAAMFAQVVLCGIGLFFTATDFQRPSSSSDGSGGGGGGPAQWLILAVVVAAGVAGAALLVPRLRRRLSATIKPQFQAAHDNLRLIARDPRKAVELFGGNVASQLFFALTISAALHAYGGSLPLLQIVVINTFASLIGGIAPVPGGMGVIEAGLIGGLTAAGVDEATAIATTFTARMFTAYLPPIWGWFSLDWLRKHDYV